jgi:hypothetical protein
MKRLRKYMQVAQIMWKSMLAYQIDTWMGAGLTGFRVLPLPGAKLWLAIPCQ